MQLEFKSEELQQVQDDNAAIDFETQTLQRTLDKELGDKCRLEGAKQALEARVAQLTFELGATQTKLKTQVETLQRTLDQELEAKSRLEDGKEALEARMAQLTFELGATQSELKTQVDDLADCREKLAEALCKAAKLYAEAADLQQSMEHETAQRQQERAESTNERQAAQTERDVLVTELNAATRELDLAKAEHASLVLKLKEEHMQVRNELEAKLLSLTDQLATAQEEHAEVKIEIKKVSAQRSSAALLHKEEQERRELQERQRQVCASVSVFVPALVCAHSAEHHPDTRVYRYACPGLLAHRHSPGTSSQGYDDVPLCRALCYLADACQCVQSQEVESALNDLKDKVRLQKSRALSAQKPRASHAHTAPLLDTPPIQVHVQETALVQRQHALSQAHALLDTQQQLMQEQETRHDQVHQELQQQFAQLQQQLAEKQASLEQVLSAPCCPLSLFFLPSPQPPNLPPVSVPAVKHSLSAGV
jgi:hypothetical protein